MRRSAMFTFLVRALASGMIYGLLCGAASICTGQTRDEDAAGSDGRELFLREWIPGDPRSVAGDGLGPLFNDTSCVACHNQGGLGGAGPAAKNIQILTLFKNRPRTRHNGVAVLFSVLPLVGPPSPLVGPLPPLVGPPPVFVNKPEKTE